MIRFYRKKPVVIEAVQLKDLSHKTVKDCLEFMGQTVTSSDSDIEKRFDDYISIVESAGGIIISTLEGDMTASVGDYIIKGVQGEFYPCRPDIFEQTYEPVTGFRGA